MTRFKYLSLAMLLSILVLGCDNSPKYFGQVYIDPETDSYKKNKVKSFKIYWNLDDTSSYQFIKLDSYGQVIWQGIAPEFKNTVTEIYVYDTLGKVISIVGAKDKTVKYEEDKENCILKEIWSSKGEVNKIRWLRYSPDLKRILEERWYGSSIDTVTYEYQYENELLLRTLANGDIDTEYQYDESHRLHAIKSFGISGYIMVDYISPRTGLIDSTIVLDSSYKKTQVSPQYYRYSLQ